MIDKSLTISYGIPIPSFSLIKDQVNMVLEYKAKNNNNDYYIDSFKNSFSDSLKSEFVYIQEEAEMYSQR